MGCGYWSLLSFDRRTRSDSDGEETNEEGPKAFPISTANGIVQIEEEVPICIPELGIRVMCNVLANSPSLLSIGCLFDEGFILPWVKKDQPTIVGDHVKYVCSLMHNVPLVGLPSMDIAQNDDIVLGKPTHENGLSYEIPLIMANAMPMQAFPAPLLPETKHSRVQEKSSQDSVIV